jgi:phosphopantetheine adenylyltransferase
MSDEQHNLETASLAAVRCGRTSLLWSLPDGTLSSHVDPDPHGIVCGSFDPRHHGHERLRDAAAKFLDKPVHFELSLVNVEKPTLDDAAVEQRRCQFHDHPLALTAAATFVEKAVLLPETIFVVGIDTAVRIVDSSFYDDDTSMQSALHTLADHACSFLVAGRLVEEQFQTIGDVDLPSQFEALFVELPEVLFREDVSSTALRRE